MSVAIPRGRRLRRAGDLFALGDAALLRDEDGAAACAGGASVAAGLAAAALAAHPGAEVRAPPGRIVAPGVVDCRARHAQTGVIASRGAQPVDWRNRCAVPEESRCADPARAAAVARLVFDAWLRNGIGAGCASGAIHAASVEALMIEAEARGRRAVASRTTRARHAPDELCEPADLARERTAARIARWQGRVRRGVAMAPRFAPTSSPRRATGWTSTTASGSSGRAPSSAGRSA